MILLFNYGDDPSDFSIMPAAELTVVEVEADAIVGEYEPDEMYPNQNNLIVSANGTYTWGTSSGTWTKNSDDDYYTFNNASGQPLYTADLTEESILLFAYGDDPMDFSIMPVAELAVVEDDNGDEVDIIGAYTYDVSEQQTATLTVNADFSFTLENTEQGDGTGFWFDNQDGTYEFSVYYGDDEDGITYFVRLNNDNLEFYEDGAAEQPVAIYAPAA